MYTPARYLGLLALLQLASAFFLDSASLSSGWGSSYCTRYSEYNTLLDLTKHDKCMNIDSVFKLLADMTSTRDFVHCRSQVISLLADHFGENAVTPDGCTCHGANKLQTYHTGSGDGVPELKKYCLSHDTDYRKLYDQFFKDGSSHHGHHVPACRTHHSLWSSLNDVLSARHNGSSCQADIIFHLKYAFEHHTDACSCTGHIPQPHVGSQNEHCLSYNSYNALLKLGNTDGCLSANSVWHYLDDLQVKDPTCRQKIQTHMADKYTSRSHYSNDCTCHARRVLVDQQIHRMANGSFFQCLEHTAYKAIESELFSHISSHGCQNHDYLWSKLESVHNYCTHGKCTDCTQDLIVRAALQYPTDASDNCVCSQLSPSTQSPTTTTTRRTTTASTTVVPTTAAPTTAAPTTAVPTTAAPTTTVPTTTVPTTATLAVSTSPPKKFSCSEIAVVKKLVNAAQVRHSDSSPCDSNAGSSDDAYVLSSCNVTSPMTWRKGANVMVDCESSTHLISGFTPISTFSGQYSPQGAQPGIFLECYNAGFKMAIQKCDGVPEIVHIENGVITNNPNNYYVIV